jgi:hypothetical protein
MGYVFLFLTLLIGFLFGLFLSKKIKIFIIIGLVISGISYFFISENLAYELDIKIEKINIEADSSLMDSFDKFKEGLNRLKKDSEILLNKDNEEIMKRLKKN